MQSFLLAIALAMDAFAISISSGVQIKIVGKREIFRISWHFALFQALFFIAGYFSGLNTAFLFKSISHITAGIILILIGGHMLIEAFSNDEKKNKTDPSRGKTLIMLSIATSIDALAAGFSFSIVNSRLMSTSLMIFFVTLILSIAGTISGNTISNITRIKVISEFSGGIILIALAVKFFFRI